MQNVHSILCSSPLSGRLAALALRKSKLVTVTPKSRQTTSIDLHEPAFPQGYRERLALGGRTMLALARGRKRYLRALGAFVSISGIYARWRATGKAADLQQAHQRAGEKLADLARRNGGGWVKTAQFFSTRPDILPAPWVAALEQLQHEATPVPFARIRKVLLKALGARWQGLFLDFDEIPVATASIAQLHRAVLQDGRAVAVKVRLPGVREEFLEDAESFRLLARWIAPWVRELDLNQIVAQLVQLTTEELDFRHETENLQRFRRQAHHADIRIPEPVPELCSESVQVTVWEDGTPLRLWLEQHPEDAGRLLNLLLGSYLQQVTRFGIFQADPHPGNFLVNDKGQIVILDYGAMGRLSSDEVRNYSRLLYGLMGFVGDVDVAQLFADAGFSGGDPASLRRLTEYITTDKMKQVGPLLAMEELLTLFREHHIGMPDSWVALSRVLITLGGLMMAHGVPMDWTPPEQRRPLKPGGD